MRPELKELDYYIYGLSEADFDYFLDLVLRLSEGHIRTTAQQIEPYRDDPDKVEAVADLEYYAFVDTTFLWEYALWRLQGVFEGILVTSFLAGRDTMHLPGIKSKLQAMRKAGYTISDSDFDELLDWAKLRNALSHRPPEPYRPVWLEMEDLLHYRDLVRGLCVSWRVEQASLPPAT